MVIRTGLLCVLGLVGVCDAKDGNNITFVQEPGKVFIRSGDRAVATYVYKDRRIKRPYSAHMKVEHAG